MEFNEVLKDWNKQEATSRLDEQETIYLVRKHVRKLDRSNFLILFFSGFISLLAFLLLVFWAYLFLTIGAAEMRSMDIFPPFGWFILFPFYVMVTGLYILISQKSKRKKQRMYETVSGLLQVRKDQMEKRISLFHKLPFIYLIGLLVTTFGHFITPEFSYFTIYSLPVAIGLFVPDIIIMFVLTVLTRKKIRNKYQPQLEEIETLIEIIKIS